VTRWTELLLLLSLLLGGGGQSGAPGAIFTAPDAPRAVLLEAAELYDAPSSRGDAVESLDAGSVLEYSGETTDEFGRTWYRLQDPRRLERRRDVYLAPFNARQYRDFGYRGALLADRQSTLVAAAAVAAAAAAAAGEPAPAHWWQPTGVLELGNTPTFEGVLGISATAADVAEVREAIDLLGGLDAIAAWPVDPLPGELFVPAMLPALFQFDGRAWNLAQPVRLLDDSVNLIGNGRFALDPDAPPLAAGPAFYCWSLVGGLDARGRPAGSVAVAPAVVAAPRGGAPPRDMGSFRTAAAPPNLRGLLPPAPDSTRVPERVDPAAEVTGVLLADADGRQAVYIQQHLGGAMTHRLRGKSLVLDVLAREDPRAAAATFGIDIEVTYADGRAPENLSTSYTASAFAYRYEWAFEVPADADDITVRLLPLDRSLAVEQRASVIFDRVSLRLESWDPVPPPGTIVLNRITSNSFEGAPLYTRTPVAVSRRSVDELEAAWPGVAAGNWSVADQQMVLAGELRSGMSPEQVTAAWGNPPDETTQPAGDGVQRRWDYSDRYVVFIDDEVILFRPPATLDASQASVMCPGEDRSR